MKKPLWGSAYDLAALLLRLVIVAYAVLIVGWRQAEPWEYLRESGYPAPEVARQALIAALTLAPLAYALSLTRRSLFGASLLVACYATYEVLASHGGIPLADPFEDAALPRHVQVLLVMPVLLGLWASTLLFGRAEARRSRPAAGVGDERLAAAIVLVFALPGAIELAFLDGALADAVESLPLISWVFMGLNAALIASAWRLLRHPPSASPAPHHPWALRLGYALVVGLLCAGLAMVLHAWHRGSWWPGEISLRAPDVEWFLMAGVAGPLLEEWAFRGVLWRALERRFGAVHALLTTSTAFALSHLLIGPVVELPEQMVMGLLFGLLRWRTGRVWPCVLAHALCNVILISTVPGG